MNFQLIEINFMDEFMISIILYNKNNNFMWNGELNTSLYSNESDDNWESLKQLLTVECAHVPFHILLYFIQQMFFATCTIFKYHFASYLIQILFVLFSYFKF